MACHVGIVGVAFIAANIVGLHVLVRVVCVTFGTWFVLRAGGRCRDVGIFVEGGEDGK